MRQNSSQQHERHAAQRPTTRPCREIGHDWGKTTVDYRTCQRSGCHAAQRLVRGKWREVTVPTQTRSCQQPSPVVQPMLFRPGRDFYDRNEERRAELALLDLLRH